VIAVRNLGPTLSKKEQDGLFKPFYKNTDPEKEGVESNGMGLSVSQQIA
jgi:K+-sensing histidine kinase KdpD